MGIKDVISRFHSRRPAAGVGDVNEPEDTRGEGPATLADRTEPGGQGSPGTNQAKTEPMPSTPGHRDPNAPLPSPPLDEMTVGAPDAQAPSSDALPPTQPPAVEPGPTNLGGPGVAPQDDRPVPDLLTSRGRDLGPEQPRQDTPGEAHRVPGLAGSTPPGEAIETDVQAGADRMHEAMVNPAPSVADRPVETGGVPINSTDASAGTSEELPAVQGVRLPDAEEGDRGKRPE